MKRSVAIPLAALALTAASWTAPALAVQPDEMLADPALEARAREISRGLRCLVCQNESIDESNADLAHDLRLIVRERLKAGDSDEEVVAYITARYGDFVLLRPPMEPATWLLWFGPAAILLIGAGGLMVAVRRRRITDSRATTSELNEAERARLAGLLRDDTEKTP